MFSSLLFLDQPHPDAPDLKRKGFASTRAKTPEEAMSDTLVSLRRKIGGAGDLESVVRSMKALAASSIGQYEKAVLALRTTIAQWN